jgi:betaine-aldehyde dehydrogenase
MRDGSFINGATYAGTSTESIDVIDPATSTVVATCALASPSDVDAAVRAARAAYADWSRTVPAERSAVLHDLAARMSDRAEEYVAAETAQTGKPLRLSREFDVPGSIDNASFFAGAARNLEGKASTEWDGVHTSIIRREPIGVVGSIAPWNYPLQMAMWKMLPAVAAGNTIVLKPAEITPLTSIMLAEDCMAAGMPAGVVNVICGTGPIAGEALISHPDVNMVSFTGSTPVGRRVMELATAGIKRVHLELGGKAPFVVFDDADLEAAIQGAAAGALINSGQDCTAATRAYVQRPLYQAFCDGVADLFSAIRVGSPLDEATDIGPLISRRQQERVSGFVERARAQGARILTGGSTGPADLADGAFYLPTIVTDVQQDWEIVQQELFGPVLVVLPFDTDDEGIALANDSVFGLAASAWTTNVFRALRAQRDIHAGCVWINDHIPIVSEMPHGGFGQSGFGKDMSAYSFEEYTQIKHVSMDITGASHKPWHRTIFSDKR